jgi:rare lipoprotein A
MFISLRQPASLLLCALLVLSGLSLSGCSSKRDPFAGVGSPVYKGGEPMPFGGGRSVVGKPYYVAGLKFTPRADPTYDRKGVASWYGKQFHRRMTSNGEWFDMNQLTAAHTTMPLPSYAKVTNLENGREVIVRVNDRGPFVGDRIIDMSKRSAEAIGFKEQGTAKVRVQYIGPAPNDDTGPHLMAMNEELERGTPLRKMIAAADRNQGQTRIAEAPSEPVDQVVEAVSADDYYVQAGLFANPNNALRAKTRLSGLGPVLVTPVSNASGSFYRVSVGPMPEASAMAALADVHAAGLPDARLVVAQN